MEMDQKFISAALRAATERCRRAREMGGISSMDAFSGVRVPDGWIFDPVTDFWVPRPLDATIQ